MSETTSQSPEGLQLRTAPMASARLSRKAVVTAISALAFILGVVIVNVSKDKPAKAAEQNGPTRELQPAVNAGKELTADIPDVIALPPAQRAEELPASSRGTQGKSLAQDARLADTAVAKFGTVQHSQMQRGVAGMSEEAAADGVPAGEGLDAAGSDPLHGAGGLLRVADRSYAGTPDLNRQDEKEAFARQTQHSAYLGNQLQAPVSPFELKTGTVIPSILISSINSDLPGEIIAQVGQNVYDTATGKYLLIPQGSKLFGRYDSKVAFGQRRALVNWQRLIFPNAYTLELKGMGGHDMGGESGFADRVNNHYGRVFGFALLTSVMSAGYQLSQPQQGNSGVLTNGQVAAAAVGQQMAQLGAQIASRNMQVQPTIEIRKGYRLNVMVNADIVFPGSYAP